MSLCALCGHPTLDADLCAYHGTVHDDWAVGNRVMCDFIHRGIVEESAPRRVRSRSEIALDSLDLLEPVPA
jgi:hypothetical protein